MASEPDFLFLAADEGDMPAAFAPTPAQAGVAAATPTSQDTARQPRSATAAPAPASNPPDAFASSDGAEQAASANALDQDAFAAAASPNAFDQDDFAAAAPPNAFDQDDFAAATPPNAFDPEYDGGYERAPSPNAFDSEEDRHERALPPNAFDMGGTPSSEPVLAPNAFDAYASSAYTESGGWAEGAAGPGTHLTPVGPLSARPSKGPRRGGHRVDRAADHKPARSAAGKPRPAKLANAVAEIRSMEDEIVARMQSAHKLVRGLEAQRVHLHAGYASTAEFEQRLLSSTHLIKAMRESAPSRASRGTRTPRRGRTDDRARRTSALATTAAAIDELRILDGHIWRAATRARDTLERIESQRLFDECSYASYEEFLERALGPSPVLSTAIALADRKPTGYPRAFDAANDADEAPSRNSKVDPASVQRPTTESTRPQPFAKASEASALDEDLAANPPQDDTDAFGTPSALPGDFMAAPSEKTPAAPEAPTPEVALPSVPAAARPPARVSRMQLMLSAALCLPAMFGGAAFGVRSVTHGLWPQKAEVHATVDASTSSEGPSNGESRAASAESRARGAESRTASAESRAPGAESRTASADSRSAGKESRPIEGAEKPASAQHGEPHGSEGVAVAESEPTAGREGTPALAPPHPRLEPLDTVVGPPALRVRGGPRQAHR